MSATRSLQVNQKQDEDRNYDEFQLELGQLRIADALNGDLTLEILGDAGEDVAAADLNAAAAGTFKRTMLARLVNSNSKPHSWAGFEPTLTPAYVGAGAAAAPAITGTPAFSKGIVTVELTFDTDAGATKTYLALETVTLDVQVSAADSLLGYTVAQVTKTYTVV